MIPLRPAARGTVAVLRPPGAVMAASLAQLGLVLALFCAAVVGFGPVERRLARRPWRRRSAAPGAASHRPLQVVAADLRRLARELATVPAGAPMASRRGLQAAFDDVLGEAAVLLEIPNRLAETPAGRARDVERRQLLAAVEGAGLAVRD